MKIATIAALALVMATLAAAETPAPTTTASSYDEELGCWPISVEHDATYCIDGPICSGSGAEPAGWNCPVAGDVAIADCHNYLVSYTEGDSCVLPVDATCQVIKTGAWGCVISGASSSSGDENDAGSETGSTNGTSGSSTSEDITFTSVAAGVTAGGVSSGAVAAIACAAAAVCATVGTVLYKKYHKAPVTETRDTMIDVVTP